MIELLAGAGIALLYGLLGFRLGRTQRQTTTPRVEPVCPCKHHVGEHDPQTGRCNGTINGPEPSYIGTSGAIRSWVQVPCTCLSYSGPELINLTTFRELSVRPLANEDPGDRP
jgi:hypothetical protein